MSLRWAASQHANLSLTRLHAAQMMTLKYDARFFFVGMALKLTNRKPLAKLVQSSWKVCMSLPPRHSSETQVHNALSILHLHTCHICCTHAIS